MLEFNSIRTKSIIWFSIVALITGLSVGYISYASATQLLTDGLKDRCTEKAQYVLYELDIFMYERYQDIDCFAKRSVLKENATKEEITAAMSMLAKTQHYDAISFFDMDRIRIADTEGIGIGEQDPLEGFWGEVLRGEISTGSDVHLGPVRKTPQIYFAAPVKDQENRSIGVIVSRLGSEKINLILEQHTNIKESKMVIFDKNRNILFSNTEYYKDRALEKIGDTPSVREALKGKTGAVLEYNPTFQEEYLTIYTHEKGHNAFKGNDWSFIVYISKKEVFTPITELRNRLLVLGAMIGILIIALASLLGKKITTPIKDLTKAATEMSIGNFDVKIDTSSKDEIGELARAFKRIVTSLKIAMKEKK